MSGQIDLRTFFGSDFAEPHMSDGEWERHDAQVAAARRTEVEQQRRDHRARLLLAGWPVRALDVANEVDEVDASRPAVATIDRWNPRSRSVLVLSGAPGCGKTCAAARWALERSNVTAFVRASTFATTSRYDAAARAPWLHARSLVLDDLGAEYADAKGSFVADLDELVDRFYADNRPLIVTTNVTAPEFQARYGARITDRLREVGWWQNIGGGSLRKRSEP